MTNHLACHIFHEFDGHCCPDGCPCLQNAKTAQRLYDRALRKEELTRSNLAAVAGFCGSLSAIGSAIFISAGIFLALMALLFNA